MADPPRHDKPKALPDTEGDPLGYFGASAFDGGELEGGAPVELALGHSDPPPTSGSSVHRQPSPSIPAAPELTDVEVRLLAGHGPPPSAWYLAPRYAWRVKLRQRELQRRVVELAKELAGAESARDQALASLAGELRSAAESDERYADLFEPVRRIEAVVGQQSAALATVAANRAAELARLDEERAPIEAKLVERRHVAATQAAAVAAAEHDHARADARLKRVHIEMRSIKEAAERAAGANAAMTPEQRAAIADLTLKATQIEPELRELAARLASARTEHESLVNQVGHLEAALREVDEQRAALDAAYRKQLDSQQGGVTKAEAARLTTLAAAGRTLLRRARGLGVYPERVEAVEAAERALAKVSRDHARHLAALDAFDAQTVRRGLVMSAVAVAMVFAVVLWLIV